MDCYVEVLESHGCCLRPSSLLDNEWPRPMGEWPGGEGHSDMRRVTQSDRYLLEDSENKCLETPRGTANPKPGLFV